MDRFNKTWGNCKSKSPMCICMYVFMWMCEVKKSISAITLLLHKINAYQSTSSSVYDERGEETKVSNKCLQLIDKVSLGAPPNLLFSVWLFTYLNHVCSITGSTLYFWFYTFLPITFAFCLTPKLTTQFS